MAKKVYRLWAVVHTAEAEKQLKEFRFCHFNVAEQYFLIYSERRPKGDLILTEIKEADASLLSDAERQWLFLCNLEILAAEARAKHKDILKDLTLKVGALEEALRAEAEKENGERDKREEGSDVGENGESKT